MKTLTRFLVEEQRKEEGVCADLRLLIEVVARACKAIGLCVSRGAPGGMLGDASSHNIQGETQKKLDVLANDIMLEANEWGGHLAAMASEEMPTIWRIPEGYPRGKYLLLFDPIDGSSNIDVNLTVGTIFSVLRAPADSHNRPVVESDFLQSGRHQVAAGYTLYGPQTIIVLSLGAGVYEFALDRETGSWVMSGERLQIPRDKREFAVNISNRPFWTPEVQQYVDECIAGARGPVGLDYNMRWTGSMVADIHRILKGGGVFLYPYNEVKKSGKLRLMYEANPMSFIIDQAGGKATDGVNNILDKQPSALHERTGIVIGDTGEVKRLKELYNPE